VIDVPGSNEFREYENGIADILAAVAGAHATVRRNIELPAGADGRRRRQIDVLVEGRLFALTEARMIVDCKRWKKPIDVADVDAFLGMVADVRADAGMLVSASGASAGAVDRAAAVGGIRIKTVSLAELRSWRPRGTVFKTIELGPGELAQAAKALREIGLRVAPLPGEEGSAVQVEVFRHHGVENPSGELQQTQHRETEQTLDRLRIAYRTVNQGIVISGGTPGHRWLPVTVNGVGAGVMVLAATEADIELELDRLAPRLGCARRQLDVTRPGDWPIEGAFPFAG